MFMSWSSQCILLMSSDRHRVAQFKNIQSRHNERTTFPTRDHWNIQILPEQVSQNPNCYQVKGWFLLDQGKATEGVNMWPLWSESSLRLSVRAEKQTVFIYRLCPRVNINKEPKQGHSCDGVNIRWETVAAVCLKPRSDQSECQKGLVWEVSLHLLIIGMSLSKASNPLYCPLVVLNGFTKNSNARVCFWKNWIKPFKFSLFDGTNKGIS